MFNITIRKLETVCKTRISIKQTFCLKQILEISKQSTTQEFHTMKQTFCLK